MTNQSNTPDIEVAYLLVSMATTAPTFERATLLRAADLLRHAAQPTPEPVAQASIAVDPKPGTVHVYVVGQTGSGKSGVAGEIEIAMKALGIDVEWPAGVAEKNMTGADWQTALELYRPRVVIHEINVVNGVAHG